MGCLFYMIDNQYYFTLTILWHAFGLIETNLNNP